MLRRVQTPATSKTNTVEYPGLSINIHNYEVMVNNEPVAFTPKEVELLYTLCATPGRVYSREQLLSDIWGYKYYGDSRVVDSQIKRIRAKLPANNDWAIKSVYGVGYKFELTNA